ncbi:MAG: Elongation factor Ts [Candidatus Yanofskybacteria bacterium GW2011_GWF1_44_227]|uniref:Elongation factor Ts n=1 Tax=Candidatus Yanofskybacteria bacterium GW2011_GWE2_40_11 TaxID=1619033 RepID=A0A0G0T083_9BACT|nr:MAG: Elongation factor Ts [Candidatus Yanofskybacteria bacterium GW2011_GWE1_40_10]KKR40535.1 MAG: Elongation factor Ts [Candidatus Yanofskybacteria bacterium GW2011_GWE2_40_11]KKT15164.1 MAG: Elongation factor Ts [Candidatus Yanofskybacteria bacterium GW2011_GWF2_43_596]KKT52803.1 MAG: Elongation factor Ts [Candidatus Yanofskybacteria bacterium GW2011_GWF1_44_227]OGN35467.1 MAG: translation elongation factor Ts [Candidatus Yanofskybacteria bacterium RIFOXYA1_FULL_44_17]OGN36827.1 MAG: tran
MSNIDVNKVKELRESTGLSFGEIKKALEESGGDEAKTMEILKNLGSKMADKKSDRELKSGIVEAYIHGFNKGAMIELLCESDFVARNAGFKELAHDIAMQVAATKPANVEELMEQEFIKDPAMKIRDLVNSNIAKIGENIQVGRFEVFEI